MSSRHPTVYSTSPLGHLNIISSITYPEVICAPFQHKSPILVCRKFFLAFAQAKTWERFLTFFPSHPTSSLSVNPVSLTFKWISALTISHLLHSCHLVQAPSSLMWITSVVSKLISLLLPFTLYSLFPMAAWGSDLSKCRPDHVTPLFKTLQMLPFLKEKAPNP